MARVWIENRHYKRNNDGQRKKAQSDSKENLRFVGHLHSFTFSFGYCSCLFNFSFVFSSSSSFSSFFITWGSRACRFVTAGSSQQGAGQDRAGCARRSFQRAAAPGLTLVDTRERRGGALAASATLRSRWQVGHLYAGLVVEHLVHWQPK